MKLYSSVAQAALDAGDVIVSGAVKLALSTPFLVWGGYEPLTLASEVYTGIGDRGLVQASSGQLGGAANGPALSLSGVDPDVAALIDTNSLRGAAAVIWRLIFDGSGRNLLDARVWDRGRCDRLTIEETPAGTSTLKLSIEGAARGMGRHGGRMRTDADQRLIQGDDGGFKAVSTAPNKTLNLGGKPPARVADALPNSGGSAVGYGGGVNLSTLSL